MTDVTRQTLQQLRDLHLPAPVSWWPLAPLWWFVLMLLGCAIAWMIWRLVRRHTPRGQALLQIDQHYNNWCHSGDTTHYFTCTNQLLRKIAIKQDGRQQVARLTGDRWIDWLDSRTGTALPAATRKALADGCYRQNPQVKLPDVHNDIARWISTYRGKRRA